MSSDKRRANYQRQRINKVKNGRNSPTKGWASSTPLSLPDSTFEQSMQKDTPEYIDRLIRRLFRLHHDKVIDMLGQLTCSKQIDSELYALIGLLFRWFIFRWYEDLTDDQDLTEELLSLCAHVTKELDIRIRNVNIVMLLLDDVPYLLAHHLNCYRIAHQDLGSTLLPYDTIEAGFDYLSNHVALCEDLNDEQRYLRILSKAIIVQLFPKEENSLAVQFLNAVTADQLLRNLIEKISQPYQIFEIIQLICRAMLQDTTPNNEDTESVSTGYQKFSNLLKSNPFSFRLHATSLHIFAFINMLLRIDSQRPLLSALIRSIVTLQIFLINTILTNIIMETVLRFFESEDFFVMILRSLRNNLFPTDQDMGPPRIEPSPQECTEIKETTKMMMKEVLAKHPFLTFLFITSNDLELNGKVDSFLAAFDNQRINKHLIFKLLDLCAVKLFPEIAYNND